MEGSFDHPLQWFSGVHFTGKRPDCVTAAAQGMKPGTSRLRCPHCGRTGTMEFLPSPAQERSVVCRDCGHSRPTTGGVPDFAPHLPADDPGFSRAQRVMNTGVFARLYESPVWRPLHTRLGSGFSMGEEVRQVLGKVKERRIEAAADLACGTGHYARAFARRWPEAEIYGLDISPGMLDRARHLAARENLDITFLRADIHRLPFPRESLDYVNCGGTLHLLSDAAPVWEEVHRVLAPGGVFTAMVVGEGTGFLRKWQRRAAPRWGTTFFTPDLLERELTKAGFEAFLCASHRLVLLVSAVKGNGKGGNPAD